MLDHYNAYIVTKTSVNHDPDYYGNKRERPELHLGTFESLEEAQACLVKHLPDRFVDYRDTRMFLSAEQVSQLKEFIDLTKLRRQKFIEREDGSGHFDEEFIAYGDKDPILTDEQKLKLHKMFGIRETFDYSETYQIYKCILVPTEVIK